MANMKKIRMFVVVFCALPLFLSSCFLTRTGASKQRDGKIRVLIIDGFSNHDWKHTTSIVKRILEESGLFSVSVSTVPSPKGSPEWKNWRPDFSACDVVVQNCNDLGNGMAWPDEVKDALVKFVRGGGGLYILHSANNAFKAWKEYNRMIGLGWRGKNFGYALVVNADGTIKRIPPGEGGGTGHGKRIDAVLTRLGSHPIHKGLPKRWKAADLEIYRYARGPAENITVLSYAKEPGTGLNFPIEWVVSYGKGRVYNSTFGHVWKGDVNPKGMRCVAFQTLLIRAIEWLATGDVTYPVPPDFPAVDSNPVGATPKE